MSEQVIDPRPAILNKRLDRIRRVLVFAGGKGGVGKSTCACAAALVLANGGSSTGLLDMDFQGASDHIILGADTRFPEEERGILPQRIDEGLRFMSISLFAGDHGVPLRGADVSNAFLELMAVTVWEDLDYLVLDMPPGIGDEIMDVLRFIPKSEIVIVTTPSTLALGIAERLVEFLLRSGTRITGLIENMTAPPLETQETADKAGAHRLALEHRFGFLGRIGYVEHLDPLFGNPERLRRSSLCADMGAALSALPSC